MREISMLALVGALALVGVGEVATPAAADPLGVDFVTPPSSSGTCAPTLECNGFLTYGYAFTVGDAPAVATGLGAFDDGNIGYLGTAGTTVGLWDANGQLLASVVVGTSADQIGLWGFATLSSSITLSPDTTYVVGAEGLGPYVVGSLDSETVDLAVNSLIAYAGDRFSNISDAFVFEFPAFSDDNGPGYFGGNIEIDPVPEPMSLSLLGMALASFGLLRRRKKN
jgi:hypothetical protein